MAPHTAFSSNTASSAQATGHFPVVAVVVPATIAFIGLILAVILLARRSKARRHRLQRETSLEDGAQQEMRDRPGGGFTTLRGRRTTRNGDAVPPLRTRIWRGLIETFSVEHEFSHLSMRDRLRGETSLPTSSGRRSDRPRPPRRTDSGRSVMTVPAYNVELGADELVLCKSGFGRAEAEAETAGDLSGSTMVLEPVSLGTDVEGEGQRSTMLQVPQAAASTPATSGDNDDSMTTSAASPLTRPRNDSSATMMSTASSSQAPTRPVRPRNYSRTSSNSLLRSYLPIWHRCAASANGSTTPGGGSPWTAEQRRFLSSVESLGRYGLGGGSGTPTPGRLTPGAGAGEGYAESPRYEMEERVAFPISGAVEAPPGYEEQRGSPQAQHQENESGEQEIETPTTSEQRIGSLTTASAGQA